MVVLAYNFILALGIVYLLFTWALGSSIKDLCAATSKNDARLQFNVGSRHCSYVYEKLLPPFTLLLRLNCVAFILVSSTTAHLSTLGGAYMPHISVLSFKHNAQANTSTSPFCLVSANCPTYPTLAIMQQPFLWQFYYYAWDILAVSDGVLYTHGPLKQLDYKQCFL